MALTVDGKSCQRNLSCPRIRGRPPFTLKDLANRLTPSRLRHEKKSLYLARGQRGPVPKAAIWSRACWASGAAPHRSSDTRGPPRKTCASVTLASRNSVYTDSHRKEADLHAPSLLHGWRDICQRRDSEFQKIHCTSQKNPTTLAISASHSVIAIARGKHV